MADAATAAGNIVGMCSVIQARPPAYFHGMREA